MKHSTPLTFLTLAAASLLLPHASAQEEAATSCATPRDAIEVALELRRREDPPPLIGRSLKRYTWRQFFSPKGGQAFDRDPALEQALAGASSRPDRSRMPEFVAAQHVDGRSIHWHLLNALYMNASRMRYYADKAGPERGRSLRLSRLMLVGEAISLPRVREWDARAREIKANSGVDFVTFMRPLNPLPPQTPPLYHGVATQAQRKEIRLLGKALKQDLKDALAEGDLRRVAERVHQTLEEVTAREQRWGVHWNMSRHTIGSLGYTALKAIQHADTPGVKELTLDYLRAVVPHTIDYGRRVDIMAQPLHAQGSGIVVNEFTDQSFLDLYAAMQTEGPGLARTVQTAGD